MNSTTRKLIGRVLVPALLIAAIVGAFIVCIIALRNDIRKEVHLNLKDIAEQTAADVEREIDNNYNILCGLEKELRSIPGDMSTNIYSFKPVAAALGLIRVAYCDVDGIAYSCNGPQETSDLKFREFFQRGMQGKNTITEILYDAMSDDHKPLNIISKPMYDYEDESKIIGVIGLTYYADKFNDTLRFSPFSGKGMSFAVNEHEQIVVTANKNGPNLGKNYYDDLLGTDEKNADIIAQLREPHEEGDIGQVYLQCHKLDFCCRPHKMLGGDVEWHIITMVPTNYLDERTHSIDVTLAWLLVVLIVVISMTVLGYMLITHDGRMRLRQLAYVDPLTGGDNFEMFKKKLLDMRETEGAFVAMDIEWFRTIKVAIGLNAADAALTEIHKTLQKYLTDGEALAHVWNDNFVMFLKGYDPEDIAARISFMAESVAALAFRLNSPAIKTRFGIYSDTSRANVDEAYNRACQAKEVVKKHSSLVFSFFRGEDNKRLMAERKLLDSFNDAIDHEEFAIVFQPKFSTVSNVPVGAEALVRWNHDGQNIPPGVFIPLFEQNGQIARLDEYIFRHVCEKMSEWVDQGKKVVPVSVNLSRATLSYHNTVQKYVDIVMRSGLDKSLIQIEITESSMAMESGISVADALEGFHEAGIKVLMDDFGTGYSSLSLLGTDGFDTIKLDKSLVDNIGDRKGETLLGHIMVMAQSLRLHVTAEGVETQEQLDFLRALNCDDIQGYLFSKPLSENEFIELIAKY